MIAWWYLRGWLPWERSRETVVARSARGVVTSPPSPQAPRFLLGKKEKAAASPRVPACSPFQVAPMAWAASSTTQSPCSLAIALMRSMSAQTPKMCTGSRPTVRGVIAAAMASGSMLKVSGSMSTKTGTPPSRLMAPAVAKKVKGVVMTSSPGFRSRAQRASMRASDPEAQPIA